MKRELHLGPDLKPHGPGRYDWDRTTLTDYPLPLRETVEPALLDELEEARKCLDEAKPEKRKAAKIRYLGALRAFSEFIK